VGQNRVEEGLPGRQLLLNEDVGSKAEDRGCDIYLMSRILKGLDGLKQPAGRLGLVECRGKRV
jgi:hypothetical protein